MIDGDAISTQWLDWAVAERLHPGETASGDAALVQIFAGGALIAVVDGLGHGREAADAARTAIETLSHDAREPVLDLVHVCHEALRGSRGCVLTLISIDQENGTFDWIGVGNVEAAVLWTGEAGTIRNERVVPRGGVVGYKLPPLTASTLAFPAGSAVILATDGVRESFSEDFVLNDPAAFTADRVLARHATGSDDALVLVARHLRGAE